MSEITGFKDKTIFSIDEAGEYSLIILFSVSTPKSYHGVEQYFSLPITITE